MDDPENFVVNDDYRSNSFRNFIKFDSTGFEINLIFFKMTKTCFLISGKKLFLSSTILGINFSFKKLPITHTDIKK